MLYHTKGSLLMSKCFTLSLSYVYLQSIIKEWTMKYCHLWGSMNKLLQLEEVYDKMVFFTDIDPSPFNNKSQVSSWKVSHIL